jgi:PKD repeat protein
MANGCTDPDNLGAAGCAKGAISRGLPEVSAAGVVIEDNGVASNLRRNIAADPLFADAANGDFSLQAGSPAIDAGSVYFELDGRVFVDLAPEDYQGSAPDTGAVESLFTSPQNQAPAAVAAADPQNGPAPLAVQFTGDGSCDPDGRGVSYAWDFEDGGTASESNQVHTYQQARTSALS